jgi:hypothetical protein
MESLFLFFCRPERDLSTTPFRIASRNGLGWGGGCSLARWAGFGGTGGGNRGTSGGRGDGGGPLVDATTIRKI